MLCFYPYNFLCRKEFFVKEIADFKNMIIIVYLIQFLLVITTLEVNDSIRKTIFIVM